jgi:trehalose 6-phosphate phosphatase
MKDALLSLPDIVSRIGSGPLLIATDFDGTLCPIAESPSAVSVPRAIAELLDDLRGSGRAEVALISGRSLRDLETCAPVTAILAGNNGLEIRGPGFDFQHPLAVQRREQIQRAREHISEAIARWPGAWIEDKGLTITVHFRAVDSRYQPAVASVVRRAIASCGLTVGARAGKKCLEVHPRCEWNKGDALKLIKSRFAGPDAIVLCAGDDRMDETMFRTNPDGVNIRVGPADRSIANYTIRNPLGMAGVLAAISRSFRHPTAAGAPPVTASSCAPATAPA